MDTWFTTETMIKSVLAEGLHVIGLVKQLKQKYNYRGHSCDLKELRTLLPKNTRGGYPWRSNRLYQRKNSDKTCIHKKQK